MRKIIMIFLSVMMVTNLFGCGGKQNTDQGNAESKYTEALEVLSQVVEAYSEDEIFAMYGGDQENAVMDAPGKFDISKVEELENIYGLPADQGANIEDAATMVHLMNANTYTGAAYRLKDGVDMNAFADSVKACVLAKQWVCGQPETLVIIRVDGRYVITAFGVAEIIEIFKTNVLSACSGAQVIVETPIA